MIGQQGVKMPGLGDGSLFPQGWSVTVAVETGLPRTYWQLCSRSARFSGGTKRPEFPLKPECFQDFIHATSSDEMSFRRSSSATIQARAGALRGGRVHGSLGRDFVG
jgi:hypothetical protein